MQVDATSMLVCYNRETVVRTPHLTTYMPASCDDVKKYGQAGTLHCMTVSYVSRSDTKT